jgi:hypothetical protein
VNRIYGSDKHVGRIHISVHDPIRMHEVHPRYHLFHNFFSLHLIKGPVFHYVIQDASSCHLFHHQITSTSQKFRYIIYSLDNIRMSFKLLHNLEFSFGMKEHLFVFTPEDFDGMSLSRYFAPAFSNYRMSTLKSQLTSKSRIAYYNVLKHESNTMVSKNNLPLR